MADQSVFIVIAIMFAFFLVGREIICWYWKINRRIELLEEILLEFRNLNKKS